MSTVHEPQEHLEDEPPRNAFQRFWRRYSPSGEFPISSVASFTLHILAAVLLALGLGSMAGNTQRPPSVSSVMVGDDESAAPGFGADGLPPGDGTLEQGAAVGAAGGEGERGPTTPTPEVKTSEKVQEVENFQPTEATTTPSASDNAAKTVNAARAAAGSASSRLADAKAMLNKNLGGGGGGGVGDGGGNGTGGGKGEGGGGGSGLTGRAARPARWVLQFTSSSTQDYLAQFEGLGAALAFPSQGNKWKFFSRPASNPSESTIKDLSSENRLYWVDENPGNIAGVTQALGIPNGGVMVTFLPLELEKRMLQLEKSYRGLAEEDIQTTYFGITRGAKYDVIVVNQIPR